MASVITLVRAGVVVAGVPVPLVRGIASSMRTAMASVITLARVGVVVAGAPAAVVEGEWMQTATGSVIMPATLAQVVGAADDATVTARTMEAAGAAVDTMETMGVVDTEPRIDTRGAISVTLSELRIPLVSSFSADR